MNLSLALTMSLAGIPEDCDTPFVEIDLDDQVCSDEILIELLEINDIDPEAPRGSDYNAALERLDEFLAASKNNYSCAVVWLALD